MLKKLEGKFVIRSVQKITRSPNHYPNYKTSNQIKQIDKYKGSVVIFNDMLVARNSSRIVQFFTRARHEDLDIYYFSQRFLVCRVKALELTVIDLHSLHKS